MVMEGLKLMLNQTHFEGKIYGVKISRLLKIFNLLFANDVLIMTRERVLEWKEI
jgi:hypothetical protein